MADDLDNGIAAYMLNIVFSGVDLHLSKVLERRKAYNKAISRLVSTGGATPIDALKGATAGIDGGVTASAIGEVSAMLLSAAQDAIGNIRVNSDFREMRHLYGSLYEALRDNAESGRFIVGQRILSSSEMRAFSKSSSRGPIHKEDMSSPVGDPSSIRKFLESKHEGIDRIISDQEFTAIMEKRVHVGGKFQESLTNVESHNTLTPPKNVRIRSEE